MSNDNPIQSNEIEIPSNIQDKFLCCDGFSNSIETYGDAIDRGAKNGISVQFFEPGGRLCFHDLILDGISNPFGVTIRINNRTIYGKIKAVGKFSNEEVVYVSPTGQAYRGKLTKSTGFDNILNPIGDCSKGGTPDNLDEGLFPIATFKNAFSIYYDSNTNEVVFIEADTLGTIYKSEVVIPRGRWTHLAIVRKGSKLSFYVNGRQTQDALESDINYQKPTSIEIGRGKGTNQEYSYLLGEIDSLKIVKNFVKYHCNFEPDNINDSILPETPTPTVTITPTPTVTQTPTPTFTPIPQKELRVYTNIKDLASSVRINGKEHFVDEFHAFQVLPGATIEFLPGPNQEYKFLRLHGHTEWITEYTGKMPDRDVDVHFEYQKLEPKDFMRGCDVVCPCEDKTSVEFEIEQDPRIHLDFFEHIEEKEKFRRVVEFEDELPKTAGIECEYDVTMIDGELIIKSKESKIEYAWRDLILLRNNKYKFNFDENSVIFKMYDAEGNELGADDGFYNTEDWVYPLIVLPNDKTPDYLYYELVNIPSAPKGNISVKNANYISGVITGYNFVFGAKVSLKHKDEELKKVATYKNGVFHVGLDSYIDANDLVIESTSGLEPALESNVKCVYRNIPGYFDANIISTLFFELLKQNKNYVTCREQINRFLGIRKDIDLISRDYMTTYMWTDEISFEELTRILFFNLLGEFAFKHEKSEKFCEVIVDQIQSNSNNLKYINDYYVRELMESSELDVDFSDLFSLLYVKVLAPRHRTHQEKLHDLYSNLFLIKEQVIEKESFSVYAFHQSYNKEISEIKQIQKNPIVMPEQILMKSENCTNPQLGQYTVRKLDDILMKSVFGEVSFDFERLKFLNHRTLRIYALQKSFCYTIIPTAYNLLGIFDEVDSYRIYGDFDEQEDCCDIVKRNEGYSENNQLQEISEQEIVPIKLIEAGSSRVMLSKSISNKNCPIEKINNNQYRVYINETIKSGNVTYSSPGYLTTAREFANKLMYRGIDAGYNSNEQVREVTGFSPDTTTATILTTWMTANGTLNIVPDLNPHLNIGDYITITGATRNASINGTYRVKDTSENSFALDYSIPINMEIKDMQNLNGSFETSYATRIYTNAQGLSVGNELIFDFASGGGHRYEILKVSQDEAGVYALIKGRLDFKPRVAVKSNFSVSDENYVKFTYETKLSYYNASGTDPQKDSLWLTHLPDITPDGRFNDDLSFVELYHEDISEFTDIK